MSDPGEPEYPLHWKKKAIPPHLAQPKKFNSTSSLFIDSTIVKPKNAELMQCLAEYLLKLVKTDPPSPQLVIKMKSVYEIFDEVKHPVTSKHADTKNVPSVDEIHKYIKSIFKVGQLAAETLIMAVAYLNRIMQSNDIQFSPITWRRVTLSCLILASKVWEDQAVWNIDFIDIFPLTTPHDLGQLEKKLLTLLNFDVSLKASEYAQIYFDLRAQSTASEEHFQELKPLDQTGQQQLELRTQHYTAQTKKLFRSSGSVDDINMTLKSPRAVLS